MSQVTVVIPTLCNSMDIMSYTLNQLQQNDVVKSIIIFDNTLGSFLKVFTHNLSKLVVYSTENVFVNPAWNRGVALCDTEYYLLLNDDIICSKYAVSACAKVLNMNPNINLATIRTVTDVITQGTSKYFEVADNTVEEEPYFVIQGTKHTGWVNFFGWFIFGRKSSWEHIPEEMQIFYGDNLIYFRQDTTEPKIAFIHNYAIYHRVSSTVRANQKHSDWRMGVEKPYYDKALAASRELQKQRGVYE